MEYENFIKLPLEQKRQVLNEANENNAPVYLERLKKAVAKNAPLIVMYDSVLLNIYEELKQ